MVKRLNANFYYIYRPVCYYTNKFGDETSIEKKDAEEKLMNCLINPEFIEYAKYDKDNDKIIVKSDNFRVTIDSVSKYLDVPGMREFYYELLIRQGIVKKVKNKRGKFKLQTGTIIKGTAIALLLAAVLVAVTSRTEFINIDGTKTPTEIVHQITKSEGFNVAQLDIKYNDSDTKDEKQLVYQEEETKPVVEYVEETVITRVEDNSNCDKINTIKNNYMNVIENMCEIYGLNPNLMLAIACREADTDGLHSTRTDRAAIGLCQLERNVWVNYQTKYYNPHSKQWETIIISVEDLQDLEKNISLACRYFKEDCLTYGNFKNGDINDPNGNIFVAIQCYNFGFTNMNKALGEYARIKGCTIQDVINDKNDLGWLDYLYVPDQGNPDYIPGVMSFIDIELFAEEFNISNEQLNQIKGINARIEKRIK